MRKLLSYGSAIALAAGVALAAPAFAQQHHGGPGGGTHGGSGSHGPSGGGSFHAGGSHGPTHFAMPSHGFHGTPPGFHGNVYHGGPSPSHFAGGHGGPSHFGTFHGHDFGHFSPEERAAWRGGEWRHAWHGGHFGWWWFVGGLWFFYPAPIYPYPLYVGPDYYYDYYDENGAPDYYWYYCENPPGYYPYVQQCFGPWQPVPPQE